MKARKFLPAVSIFSLCSTGRCRRACGGGNRGGAAIRFSQAHRPNYSKRSSGMTTCSPRVVAVAPRQLVQPKVDLNEPIFGAPVIEPGRAEEMLAYRIEADYPQIGQDGAHSREPLRVLIDKQGHITKIKAISGHPILIQSAMDAVKHWEYKPFQLNAEPAEV